MKHDQSVSDNEIWVLGGFLERKAYLESVPLLLWEIVPPDAALFVKLFYFFVDELIWVLPLVLGPAGLDKYTVRSVFLCTGLRHFEIFGSETLTNKNKSLMGLKRRSLMLLRSGLGFIV